MKYKYTYIGEEMVFLPIQGVELKKGDTIESETPLIHWQLQEIKPEQPKK